MGTRVRHSFLKKFLSLGPTIAKSKLPNLKSSQGFSLIEAMIAISISTAVVVGTSAIFVESAKTESGQERQYWIAARRMEMQGLIRSAAGWTAILANNANMACLTNSTSCAAYTTLQPLVLPIDSILLDGNLATIGMNNKGDFCNNFDVTNGNSSCSVGMTLNWVALCNDVACLHAQPKIVAQFRIKDPGIPLQTLKSFDLVVYKDPTLDSLSGVCASMGGVLVGTTCTITSMSTACDPSNTSGLGPTYPLGFDATGAVICGKPNPGTCASSDVATGFNANGGILCAPACI